MEFPANLSLRFQLRSLFGPFSSAFLGVCPPRGEGEFIPFTGAWRWRAAATAVQTWMWLMRNEIPALDVHFWRGWPPWPLRWPTGRRGSDRGWNPQSLHLAVLQSSSPSIAYFGLGDGSWARCILHPAYFSITCPLCSSTALGRGLRWASAWRFCPPPLSSMCKSHNARDSSSRHSKV